jgi:hypothetical protein
MPGKPNRKRFLLSLVLVVVLAGCATVIRGTQDVIYVNSLETGTRISVDDTPRGKDTAMAQVKRGQPHTIRASKPGCEDVTTAPATPSTLFPCGASCSISASFRYRPT